MHIEHPHALGEAAAIQKIDAFVEGLLQRPLPAGVTVTSPQKQWTGNRMDFSFKASRGFLGATIRGAVVVTDRTVAVDVDVPAMIGKLMGEDRIRQAAVQQLDSLLRA